MNLIRTARAAGAAFALVLAGFFFAHASIGTPPVGGMGLTDSLWLNGLAGGQNYSYQYGITAHAGGTQAAAVVLNPGIYLYEVDTVASSGDSIALPQCVQGTQFFLSNAGANPVNVFGNPTVNALTAANDTINGTAGSSAYSVTNATNAFFFCAKNGAWKAVKGS